MSCFSINLRNIWAALLLLACCWRPPSSFPMRAHDASLNLDRGGFSVDFSYAGTIPTTSENLLRNGGMEGIEANGRPNGWLPDSYVGFPTEQPDERAASIQECIKPLMRWESSADRNSGRTHEGGGTPGLIFITHQEKDPG